ncbi:MAG TPA: alpha/beta fold hydrolase, partial [Ktedonobacterales bacterium]|nr:alpha/beta fold hydrolase [Ktedonobacterales bacterium]
MASDFLPQQAAERIERIAFGAENIPALVVRPVDAGPRPAVLLQHGYGAEKADLLPFASLLASHGFISLLPDAWGHGERFPASGPNWMNQLSADYFLTVLRHTTHDMSEALTVLSGLPDVRSDAMVVAGFSMGALAALIVGTEDERVAGVFSASGSPLPDMLGVTIFGSTPPSAESIAWAEQHDAAAHVEKLAPKPLLL